ncbi:MAG TPA: hypothetical protein PLT47_11290, partial [Bacteroidales bacterium]|nr:hypothetical protein [Bacteroidales bacterium]
LAAKETVLNLINDFLQIKYGTKKINLFYLRPEGCKLIFNAPLWFGKILKISTIKITYQIPNGF